ncbi:MAG: lipoyl(octanoyl) transferase LipB [Cyanobacteria bacterium P01_A01_bin.114]
MDGPLSQPPRPALRSVLLCKLGVVPYLQAWAWQQQLVAQRKQDSSQPDILMLLEHPPVYTLGQGSSQAFLKFDPGAAQVELHRVERGGEVTYHCPGQLVGYPILNLRHYRQDLHWYLRCLETVLIGALADCGLTAQRIEGLTGVWVDGYKVAAIGIKVSRWITMHGFALNICPDLAGFEKIVPCGIEDRPVGNLVQFMPDLSFAAASSAVQRNFESVFGVTLQLAGRPGDSEHGTSIAVAEGLA